MENTTNKKTFIDFIKRYGYYFLLVACVLTLAVIITLSAIANYNDNEITQPTNTNTTITFTSPVLNGTILKNYSNTELQYNKTLNQWEAHFAIDLAATAGTDVLACYDGTITKVYTNTLEGTAIEIDHGNGLISKYASLSNVSLAEGTVVKQGDKIGAVSSTAGNEMNDGAHVHFEVWKDGNHIDPNSYLNISQGK